MRAPPIQDTDFCGMQACIGEYCLRCYPACVAEQREVGQPRTATTTTTMTVTAATPVAPAPFPIATTPHPHTTHTAKKTADPVRI